MWFIKRRMQKTAKASKLPPRMEMYEEERKQKEKQKKKRKVYPDYRRVSQFDLIPKFKKIIMVQMIQFI